MHTGRVSHPANMPKGSKILAPSPVALTGQIWTDTEGMQNHPVPAEMSQNEIKATIAEFADSASLAMDAGFDGVELHSANGYLLEQFLHPKTNLRKDEYGGNAERRQKFVLDVAEAVSQKIGADRTGIRISPYGAFNDMGEFEGIKDFYSSLTKRLSNLGLAYIHIVDHSSMGAPKVNPEIKKMIRKEFQGKVILSGGYTAESAEADLQENKGDLIAFGRPFIANPNLVEKLEQGLPILEANPATFYTPGKEGFTDYAS
jgi:N-ethylmaleimide reductase